MAKFDIYQMVTDRILTDLKNGTVPWEKPWTNTTGNTVARSHNDGRVYSLLNQMLLGIPGEYATFTQVNKEGGKVKKGAKQSVVVFYKLIQKKEKVTDDDGNEEETAGRKIPILRYSGVFHLDDTEGIKPKYVKSQGLNADNHTIDEIDAVVADYLHRSGVVLRHHEQDSAFYNTKSHEVIMPKLGQFGNSEAYYASLFHELGHSTGKALGRDMSGQKEKYSREELVAEITSSVLCNHFGIDSAKLARNTSSYIKGWLKPLQDDPKMVVWAANRAEKAVNLILNITKTTEVNEEDE